MAAEPPEDIFGRKSTFPRPKSFDLMACSLQDTPEKKWRSVREEERGNWKGYFSTKHFERKRSFHRRGNQALIPFFPRSSDLAFTGKKKPERAHGQIGPRKLSFLPCVAAGKLLDRLPRG